MNCDEVVALITEYLDASLEKGEMLKIQAHTSSCQPCFQELEAMSQTHAYMETWTDTEPGDNLSRRFYTMLESFEQGMASAESPAQARPGVFARLYQWPRQSPWSHLAVAALILLVGFLLGRTPLEQAVGPATVQSEQLNAMTRTVSLTLMNHQSAGERLSGVNWIYKLDKLDPGVLDTLLHLLNADANVNVRLAALDALSAYREMPEVRAGLVTSLPSQKSPLVQLELIDCLMRMKEPETKDGLRDLLSKPDLNPAVKKTAEQSLLKLH